MANKGHNPLLFRIGPPVPGEIPPVCCRSLSTIVTVRGDDTAPIYWTKLPGHYLVGQHLWYNTDLDASWTAEHWTNVRWTLLSENTVQLRMKKLRERIDRIDKHRLENVVEERFEHGPRAVPSLEIP
jgi:hypothetical protein